jgi:hypothetical protein
MTTAPRKIPADGQGPPQISNLKFEIPGLAGPSSSAPNKANFPLFQAKNTGRRKNKANLPGSGAYDRWKRGMPRPYVRPCPEDEVSSARMKTPAGGRVVSILGQFGSSNSLRASPFGFRVSVRPCGQLECDFCFIWPWKWARLAVFPFTDAFYS